MHKDLKFKVCFPGSKGAGGVLGLKFFFIFDPFYLVKKIYLAFQTLHSPQKIKLRFLDAIIFGDNE